MMNDVLNKLKKLSDYCDTAPTLDTDTELFETSVGVICNELWEIGIFIKKLKEES